MALRQSQHRCLETPELLPVPVVCRRLARVRHPSAQTGSGVAHELSRWNGFFKGLAEPLSGPFRRPNDLALLDTTPASCSDLVKGVAGIETTLGWHGFLKTPRRTPIARPSCRGRVRSPAAKRASPSGRLKDGTSPVGKPVCSDDATPQGPHPIKIRHQILRTEPARPRLVSRRPSAGHRSSVMRCREWG